jgi:hypothetical protein
VSRGGADPTMAVVGPVIRDLTARRLVRGYLALVALGGVALVEWALMGPRGGHVPVTLVGALLSALAMLAQGMATVKRAFDVPPRLWGPLGSMGSIAALFFGLWLFGLRGLREVATGSAGLLGLGFAVLYVVFGLRLLRDALRVGDVAKLARVMAVPAPEEAGT